ncbi:hypothetical protein ACGFX2_20130 [Streptomyces goshikiensis]|uniref:hypothetical protein n=1 Tax=Streptomyces goshikiensis TaxID=1942 RepID=UPI003719257E
MGGWTALAGAAACLATQAGQPDAGGPVFAAIFGGPALLLALVPVLAPPDLRTVPRIRTTAGAVAVTVWTLVPLAALVVCPLSAPLGGLRFTVALAGGLTLAGRQAFARLRTAPAVLLGELTATLDGVTLAPALALAVVAVAVSVHRRRTARPAPPAPRPSLPDLV